jgi:hypothetical protein
LSALVWTCGLLGIVFLAASTSGYLVSFVSWRWPRGRGFECTHFFYVVVVGVSATGWAVSYYPPAALWPDTVVMTIAGTAGITVLLLGMISIAIMYERREKAGH